MWYRANTTITVDYANYHVTFGPGEVFYSPNRYQIQVIYPVPDPVKKIAPAMEEIEQFVTRILNRNQQVKRPLRMDAIDAVKRELVDRHAKITQEVIANELGCGRFHVNKYQMKIRRIKENDMANCIMSTAK